MGLVIEHVGYWGLRGDRKEGFLLQKLGGPCDLLYFRIVDHPSLDLSELGGVNILVELGVQMLGHSFR